MNESEVKKQVKDYLDIYGWFHFPVIQDFTKARGMRGVPDRIAMKEGLVLFIEVKRPGGKLSPAQVEFKHNTLLQGCHYLKVTSAFDIERYINEL